MSLCDLHTHSTYSDGTCTPAQLIHLAQEAGLRAVALCDHNTVAGLPDFLASAEGSPVEAIPGVEFSTDHGDTELHILALFVQPQHYAPITDLLEEAVLRKERSNMELVAALAKAGVQLDYDAIKASTPNGQVNRAVIGAQMLRQGYVSSVREAFSQWLSPKRGFYTPPRRPDACATIRFIRELGAVPVLAHPFLNLEEAALRAFLPEAKAAGLCAMETQYSKFDPEQTAQAKAIADAFGLLHSGGSDFHGENKPDIRIGVGRGDLRIDYTVAEKMKKYVKENSNLV